MNIITQFINAFLHTYLVCFFFSTFWKIKYNKFITSISVGLITLSLTCSLLFLSGSILRFILVYVLTLLLSMLYEMKLFHKFIYVSMIYAINSIIEAITAISTRVIFANDFILTNSKVFIVAMMISKLITFFLLLIIRLRKHSSLVSKSNKSFWSVLAFPLATLMLSVLIAMIFSSNPEQSIVVQILVLATYTVLITANMIIFDFIDSLYLNTVNEGRIITANEIISNQKEQYKALIDHNREIAQIQHDNKHLFFGLISEMKKGNYEAVMTGLSGAYEICEKEIANDSIIDSIVNAKAKEAREMGISIDYEYRHLRDMKISPMDIAIVLGNALDNAIEACKDIDSKEDTTIYVYVALKGDSLVILIKNPVNDNVDVANLVSKKDNTELHGFGVLSMKQIAKKYDGEVVFKCEENVFSTTIFMCNTQL
ncbi:MAG: GHKL domain-containing protein [Ruminococcaceae bacterium]|nr:GHKL domain-containing protein [Oscillospiraceae bacterium]